MRTSPWKRPLAGVVLCLAFLSAFASVAHAVTLSAPADALSTVSVRVTPSADETRGVAVVLLDGRAVSTCTVDPALPPVVLKDFALGNRGLHHIRLVLRSGARTVASNVLAVRSWGRPGAPALVSPQPGSVASKVCAVSAKTGYSTAEVSLYLNGKFVRTVKAASSSNVALGTITLGKGTNTITLVAANPLLKTTASYTVKRLEYPWPTCIIIDKSDFKLYWIKDGVLVKTYPIATGRASMETPAAIWRVGAKYITDPSSVYGPRKMRLYRKVGDSFVYTRYLIHGTNQPWVIGTKASHGCIRMYNSQVLELYPQVPIGTMVQTRE